MGGYSVVPFLAHCECSGERAERGRMFIFFLWQTAEKGQLEVIIHRYVWSQHLQIHLLSILRNRWTRRMQRHVFWRSHGMKFSVYKVFFPTLIRTLSFSPFSWLPSGHIVKNFSTLLVSISSSEDWWADIRTNKKILTDHMEKIKSTKALIYRLSIRLRWWGWGRWCQGAEDGCEEL